MKFTADMVAQQNARFDEAGRRRKHGDCPCEREGLAEHREDCLYHPSRDHSLAALKPRLRQSQKPLLNKLEAEWHGTMLCCPFVEAIHCQAQRFELARGLWYKPDFTCLRLLKPTAYEVKGPHAFRGGFENLKMAARAFPEIEWRLVWKDEQGNWQEQLILA